MIDHLRNTQSVGLEDLAVLVLDEADRLLEMGFAEEVRSAGGWGAVCLCVCDREERWLKFFKATVCLRHAQFPHCPPCP